MKTIQNFAFLFLVLFMVACGNDAVEPQKIQATTSLTITAGDQTFTAEAANIKATYYPTGWSNNAQGQPTDEENLIRIEATANTGELIEVILFDIDQNSAALKNGQSVNAQISLFITRNDQTLYSYAAAGDDATILNVSKLSTSDEKMEGSLTGKMYRNSTETLVGLSGKVNCYDFILATQSNN